MSKLSKKAKLSLKSKKMNQAKVLSKTKTTKQKIVKQRDMNILLSIKGEINLNTKKDTSNKNAYTRKIKHKKKSLMS